ncbi:hypothetical protein C9374_012713 [Naegleria lovaniensis]|uniref:Uncharacterized protein n=1 Tax=Naegleria lovaniensis TaxID=51637 RepID=A0AA88H1R2_NAELO|nr:uncharacterized protein C9374_012713 [Naegleria lovaniensis]KAG2392461.1 hypothetical protein C9374_012713 [Naegleria lovaniensis]
MSTTLYPIVSSTPQAPSTMLAPTSSSIERNPSSSVSASATPQAVTLIKTEQHAKSTIRDKSSEDIQDANAMEEEVIWILPQTFLSVFSTPHQPVSSSKCQMPSDEFAYYDTTKQEEGAQIEQEDLLEMNPTQYLLEKFPSEKQVEQLITQKACRSRKNLEQVQNNEGRYCEVSYPDVHLKLCLYYFLHQQCWYVVGLKFLNTNPELTKIEAVDLVECRAVIPTFNYGECTGGGTSPTVGLWRQFETEYEYTFQLVLNSGAVYELIVSGLGMIHFQMMSTRPQQPEQEVYVAGENENDDYRGEVEI